MKRRIQDSLERHTRNGVSSESLVELIPIAGYSPAWLDPLPEFPLTDEPHIESWLSLSRADEPWKALRASFSQLAFPIAAGMGQRPEYRAALSGRPPILGALPLENPSALSIRLFGTPAGLLPALITPQRQDFENLVRAFAARNEPVEISASQGACLISGAINAARLNRARKEMTDDSPLAPESFKDRFLILTEGPYSNVELDSENWLEQSFLIRAQHECGHYMALRSFGQLLGRIVDEILCDWWAIQHSPLSYTRSLALQLLGIPESGTEIPDSARLVIYLPPDDLSREALEVLLELIRMSVDHLCETADADRSMDQGKLADRFVRLCRLSLIELAEGHEDPENVANTAIITLDHSLSDRATPTLRLEGKEVARADITSMLSVLNMTQKVDSAQRLRLELILDELLSNVHKYGYENPDRARVDLTLELLDSGDIVLGLTDTGRAFDPTSAAEPVDGPIEERPIGGLGLALVRRLAKRITYRREDDRNILSVVLDPEGPEST